MSTIDIDQIRPELEAGIPNIELARKYGVSRERIRQIRHRLGYAPMREIEAQRRKEQQTNRVEQDRQPAPGLSCRVCGQPISVGRARTTTVTCNPTCARAYRRNRSLRAQKETTNT